MVKKLTRAEYYAAVNKLKPRFRAISIREARVALRGRVAAPAYWFERNDVAEDDGTYFRTPSDPTISMVVDGKVSLLLYVTSGRLETCTFAYHLTPAELRKAASVMRRAGLQRLIVPAAKWAIAEMPAARRPVLEKALRSLVRVRRPRSLEQPRRRTKS
jgi:hypothetical protein